MVEEAGEHITGSNPVDSATRRFVSKDAIDAFWDEAGFQAQKPNIARVASGDEKIVLLIS